MEVAMWILQHIAFAVAALALLTAFYLLGHAPI